MTEKERRGAKLELGSSRPFQNLVQELSGQRVAVAKQRIQDGFYSDPQVLEVTTKRVLEALKKA